MNNYRNYKRMMRNRKLNRLQGYDYSKEGYYFVTICAQDRREWFGKVVKGSMVLNQVGEIVNRCWEGIPKHYNGVELDKFVVMPNHIHGIIVIVGTEQCSVPTQRNKTRNYGLLSKIVKSFKDVTTKTIRREMVDNTFGWQRSFYDHIIRDEQSLHDTCRYIMDNPSRWELDKENLFQKA